MRGLWSRGFFTQSLFCNMEPSKFFQTAIPLIFNKHHAVGTKGKSTSEVIRETRKSFDFKEPDKKLGSIYIYRDASDPTKINIKTTSPDNVQPFGGLEGVYAVKEQSWRCKRDYEYVYSTRPEIIVQHILHVQNLIFAELKDHRRKTQCSCGKPHYD